MMTNALILLIILFFVTSVIGVVTGSNSLITVPVMFQFGIDPKIAVATNMFGLTFMNIGGTIPFLRRGIIDKKKVTPLDNHYARFIGNRRESGFVDNAREHQIARFDCDDRGDDFYFGQTRCGNRRHRRNFDKGAVLTFILTFLLGIYGGLYSGGYVTMLTAALRRIFRNDVHRISRFDEVDQCFFVRNCHDYLYVARFSRLQTRRDFSRNNVCRRIHRRTHRHKIKRRLAQTNFYCGSFDFSDQNVIDFI